MESKEPNVTATATGVPSAGVVTAGKAEGSSGTSRAIDREMIAAIIRDIQDPELAEMVRVLPTPDVNRPPIEITGAERAKFLNFEAVMIKVFSDVKKVIAEGRRLGLGFLGISNLSRLVILIREMSRLGPDFPERFTERLDVEKNFAKLVVCTSNVEKEIEARMNTLFSSIKRTIKKAKAVAFEETVAVAAPEEEIPEKVHDVIRSIARKLRNENTCDRVRFARANLAFTLFVGIILRQNVQPLLTDTDERSS